MENDPQAREELLRLGYRMVPVTLVDNQAVTGFNPRALARLLGLPEEPIAHRPKEWTIQKFDQVLEAVVRAVRQVPPERLSWHSPDRGRDMRTFMAHIFFFLEYAMEALQQERFMVERVAGYDKEAQRFPDAEAIARYGEGVRYRLRRFIEGLTEADLSRPIVSYAGNIDAATQLELALGHTAQHLRHLYAYLEMMGIPPRQPLTPQDLEGLPVPTILW